MEEYVKYICDYFLKICGDAALSKRMSALPKIARLACGEGRNGRTEGADIAYVGNTEAV